MSLLGGGSVVSGPSHPSYSTETEESDSSIVIGRRPDDGILQSGFVPVDYEPIQHHQDHHNHQPSNFSVLVSGVPEAVDTDGLAKLFKEGKVKDGSGIKAFIADPHSGAPSGFHKVNLPFMASPGERVDQLPPVFIAPLGYKAPKGYKGHPLPYDPEPSDPIFETTNQVPLTLLI